MRIAVCLKQVPDTETKIKLAADSSKVETSGVKWIINPYDEHAIEEALKTRDANQGSTVTVFSVGPKSRIVDALRTALAMGCDEAVAIDSFEHLDPAATSKALARAFQKEGSFDLVFTGKLAIDDNASSVTQMLAENLSFPHVNAISKLNFSGSDSLTAEREIEGGAREVIELKLPAVVGANKGLNTPRYASLPGIMKAKKKTIKEYDLAGLEISEKDVQVKYSTYKLPPEKPAVKILSGDINNQVKELAQLLRNEAKVL